MLYQGNVYNNKGTCLHIVNLVILQEYSHRRVWNISMHSQKVFLLNPIFPKGRHSSICQLLRMQHAPANTKSCFVFIFFLCCKIW